MKKFLFFITLVLLAGIYTCCILLTTGYAKHGFKYKKAQTITIDDYLYADKTNDSKNTLSLNENGDVEYKGLVIMQENNRPINENTTSDSYLILKIYLVAKGAIPKENCDTSDYDKNGIYGLGCYTQEFKNKNELVRSQE